MKKTLFILVIASFISSLALAHSGGTNVEGCHNDTKRGTYHCH